MARMPRPLAVDVPTILSAWPGDVIAFSGADPLSDVINLATWGWPRRGASHVAIVTDDRQFGCCLCESTTLNNRPCLVRGKPVSGVQFQPIVQRVEEYPGRVWHYPLRVPLGLPLIRELNGYLRGLVDAECPYDYLGAVRSRTTLYALIQRWKHGRQDLHTLFCSELLAAAWARFDLFETMNASGWNPNALIREARRQGVINEPVRWK